MILVADSALPRSRVWCDFEIFVSLTIEEKDRDEEARAHGPYTYDVYTVPENDLLGKKRQAVGLVDGLAPAEKMAKAKKVFGLLWFLAAGIFYSL